MGSLLMHRKTNRPISICEFSIRTKSIDPIRITEKSILLKIGRQRLKFCLHPLKKRKKRCLLQPKMQNKHHFFGMDRFPSVISKNKQTHIAPFGIPLRHSGHGAWIMVRRIPVLGWQRHRVPAQDSLLHGKDTLSDNVGHCGSFVFWKHPGRYPEQSGYPHCQARKTGR